MPISTLQQKFSWFPLVGAVALPAIFIVMLLIGTSRERQAEGLDISSPPARGVQSALIEVTLVTGGGTPVVGRKVTFEHRQQGVPNEDGPTISGEIYSGTSDSSGVAAVSVPKIGMLTISVDGMEKKTMLPAMELHGSRQIRVRLAVDR